MKIKILVPVLILLLVFLSMGRLVSSQARLNDTSSARFLVKAASLDFKLNGDINSSLEIDLGDVRLGDSGIVDITVKNIGTITGKLCIKGNDNPSELLISSPAVCEKSIGPEDSFLFQVNWSLPLDAHGSGIDGTKFEFSYSFLFMNGYKVTKQVILKGTILDPVDTPTPTETETATPTPTETPTSTPVTDEEASPTPTETPTETSVPTIDIVNPIVETSTPTEVLEEVATETPVPVPEDMEVPPAVEEPSSVP